MTGVNGEDPACIDGRIHCNVLRKRLLLCVVRAGAAPNFALLGNAGSGIPAPPFLCHHPYGLVWVALRIYFLLFSHQFPLSKYLVFSLESF